MPKSSVREKTKELRAELQHANPKRFDRLMKALVAVPKDKVAPPKKGG